MCLDPGKELSGLPNLSKSNCTLRFPIRETTRFAYVSSGLCDIPPLHGQIQIQRNTWLQVAVAANFRDIFSASLSKLQQKSFMMKAFF